MEKAKQEIVGKVVSSSNDKTITVAVESYRNHPLYKKRVKSTKKYAVHDEDNKANVGDMVKAVSCRPLSKTKKYTLVEVVEKAVIL
jgi:small subunit ribosomal protein S17